MVNDVVPTVALLFGKVIELFDRVFTDFGAWPFFFGGFIMFLTYRFLLVPLYGKSGSSDTARKKTKTSNMDE